MHLVWELFRIGAAITSAVFALYVAAQSANYLDVWQRTPKGVPYRRGELEESIGLGFISLVALGFMSLLDPYSPGFVVTLVYSAIAVIGLELFKRQLFAFMLCRLVDETERAYGHLAALLSIGAATVFSLYEGLWP